MYSLPQIQVLAFHSKLLRHKEFASIQCSLPVVQKNPSRQFQNILTICCRKYAFKLIFFVVDTYHFCIKSCCMYHYIVHVVICTVKRLSYKKKNSASISFLLIFVKIQKIFKISTLIQKLNNVDQFIKDNSDIIKHVVEILGFH